jgi:hypothetical protein
MCTERLFPGDRLKPAQRPEAPPPLKPSSTVLEAPDAARIARGLAEKYGADAFGLARDRAQRAAEIGDALALEAWRSVIAALQALLQPMADA